MKKCILHILLLAAICAVCSRCKHIPPPEPCECGEVNTLEELKQWAYFKTGTYWVYEEETSHVLDTFMVLNSHDFVTSQGNEQFDYEMLRTRDQYYYRFWFNEGWSALDCNNDCCECRRLWCSKYRPGDADGQSPLLTFPTFVGSYAYLGSGDGDYGKVEVVDFLSQLPISSSMFYDVVVELNTNSVLDQNPSTFTNEYYQVKYYFAKGFGIIRKEIIETNEIWNLIDYQILQ
jgi:hypothetical protein